MSRNGKKVAPALGRRPAKEEQVDAFLQGRSYSEPGEVEAAERSEAVALPWVGVEGKTRINLEVPKALHLKLRWIGERVPESAHRFGINAIEAACDEAIERLLAEGKG